MLSPQVKKRFLLVAGHASQRQNSETVRPLSERFQSPMVKPEILISQEMRLVLLPGPNGTSLGMVIKIHPPLPLGVRSHRRGSLNAPDPEHMTGYPSFFRGSP